MKKYLKGVFLFLMTFMLFSSTLFAEATSCIDDFKGRKCDFSVGIGNKCSGLSYSKAYKGHYTDVEKRNREIYGFCYNAGDGKYFYEIVLDGYGGCTRNGKVHVAINSKNRIVLSKDLAESISVLGEEGVTSKNVGCAPYFFYDDSISKAVFSYTKMDEYEWFPDENLEFTTDDTESGDKIKTCVSKKLSSSSFCSSSNKKKFVTDAIDKCMKQQGLAYEKDSEVYNSLINELKTAFDNKYIQDSIYTCKFKECGVSTTSIANYFNSSNGVYSTETLMRNAGFTDDQIACALKVVNSEDTKQEIEDTTGAVSDQIDSTMDDIQSNLEFNNNNNGDSPSTPDGWQISDEDMTCEELLGSNLTKVVNVGITLIRIVGALAMIIFGITAYIPAVSGDNPELLKKANSKAIKMGIILILIILLPSLVKIIGNIFDFDLSCLM